MFAALSASYAQSDKNTIPVVDILTMEGESTSTSSFNNQGKPMVISMWATWCKPCILELNELQDVYEDWQEETGVKIMAISSDDARSMKRVPAFVSGKGWDFEVYLDPNADFKRAMNVNNLPHVFLLDGEGKVVWQHSGYSIGNEELLYDEILKLTGE